jgi:hypothetical protein
MFPGFRGRGLGMIVSWPELAGDGVDFKLVAAGMIV